MKKFTRWFISIIVLGSLFFGATASAASTLPPGSLFKLKGGKIVYYVAGDAVAYPFPNEQVFLSWYPSFSKVKTYDKKEVKNTLSKTNITVKPGARIVKFGDDPKLYAVSKGARLNWVTNEKALIDIFGTNWKNYFITLPAKSISQYSISSRIDKGTQYNRTTQRGYNSVTQELNRLKVLKKDFIDVEGNAVPFLKNLTETGSGSFSPKFSPKTSFYTYKLKPSEETLTLTPTAYADFMTIKVKDYPVESGKSVTLDIPRGKSTIPIAVSVPEGRTFSYEITVNRAEANENNLLGSLTENLSEPFKPLFSPTKFDYVVYANSNENKVVLKAKPYASTSRVFINQEEYTSGTSYTQELNVGKNEIEIEVYAESGTMNRYSIVVQKPI